MALIDRERLVSIGVVLEPHGREGEVKVRVLTDVPEYYEQSRPAVILETRRGLQRYQVERLRRAGTQWVMTLAGVAERSAAEALRGAEVLLEPEALKPLEAGEYFADDLIGCAVVTLAGETVGEVTGVLVTGAHEVLEVAGGRVLVPVTEEIVRSVDTAARVIRIDPVPGLLELNQ